MVNDLKIRAFRDSDKKILINFLLESAKISWPKKKFNLKYLISNIKKQKIMIAEIKGNPVGLICFSIKNTAIGKYGKIKHLYVRPEHRRKHIASMLLKIAEKEIKSKKVKTIRLVVTNTNRPGLSFSKKLGFRPVRTVFEKSI